MNVRTERQALALLGHALDERDWRLAQLLLDAMRGTAAVTSGRVDQVVDRAGARSWRLVWGLGELTRALGIDA